MYPYVDTIMRIRIELKKQTGITLALNVTGVNKQLRVSLVISMTRIGRP